MMRWKTKLGLWSLGVAVPGLVAAFATSCGNSACEDLDALCPQCPNGTYQTDCHNMVQANVLDVCSAQLPTFERVCTGVPAPPGTTTSSHSTTSSQGGTGGQATGGTGGQATGGTGGQATGGTGGSGGS
jgi:hypothetical protein